MIEAIPVEYQVWSVCGSLRMNGRGRASLALCMYQYTTVCRYAIPSSYEYSTDCSVQYIMRLLYPGPLVRYATLSAVPRASRDWHCLETSGLAEVHYCDQVSIDCFILGAKKMVFVNKDT